MPPYRRSLLLGLSAGLLSPQATGQSDPPASTPAKAAANAAQSAVRFPLASDQADQRSVFTAQLLALALQLAGWQQPVRHIGGVNQARALVDLQQGALDVAVASDQEALPDNLLQVPFPVRQGLLGFRLLVTTPERVARLQETASLEQLRRNFTLGYGQDWRDLPRLQRLGFRIVTASTYRGMFAMLQAGRFDYLSRGVSEVLAELNNRELNPQARLVSVPGLALRYPLDDFFVVRPDGAHLRQAIVSGLQTAIADGSYWRLFDAHYAQALRFARLERRRMWHLTGYGHNPMIEQAQARLLKRWRTMKG